MSIGHSVAEILNVKIREISNFGNNFLFLHFCHSPVANMAANYICIKQKTKVYGEMSYGSDTWYMGRTHEELKNCACVWLISICIIN